MLKNYNNNNNKNWYDRMVNLRKASFHFPDSKKNTKPAL